MVCHVIYVIRLRDIKPINDLGTASDKIFQHYFVNLRQIISEVHDIQTVNTACLTSAIMIRKMFRACAMDMSNYILLCITQLQVDRVY